jgi:hypothetical protein
MNPYRVHARPADELAIHLYEEIDARLVPLWWRIVAKLIFLTGHYWVLQGDEFRVRTSHLW